MTLLEKALTHTRPRRSRWLASLAVAFLAWPVLSATTAPEQPSYLYPEQRHENIGEIITQFIEKSHYNRIAVDDELSSQVMDRFIESLDRNRMYLLKGDVEFFEFPGMTRFELPIAISRPARSPYSSTQAVHPQQSTGWRTRSVVLHRSPTTPH